MFIQLLIIHILFHFSSMEIINSTDVCEKRNLCRSETNERCHAIVMKCQNHSCQYQRLNISDHRHSNGARWFYDSVNQRCRRSNIHRENYVYFRRLSYCQRSCSVIHREKSINQTVLVNLHIWEDPVNYKETVYVQLHVDLSPDWMYKLTDSMNMSTDEYRAQRDYFQNYRQQFVNFLNPMLNHPAYSKERIHRCH